MHDNTHIQTVVTDFSRSREREPPISGTFVRLNVLEYKRAEQTKCVRLNVLEYKRAEQSDQEMRSN